MTLTAPPLQLALALDVIVDEPTPRERADLLRELRGVAIGDAWVSGEYRVERDDVTGCDTIRLLRGAHVRGEWAVTSANKLAAALRLIHAELVGTGITTGWLQPGALYAEDETDSSESLCESVTENIGYNKADCDGFRQEALVAALPAFKTPTRHEHGGEFISINGHINVDQRPFIDAVVLGSKHISRDLDTRQARKILDPFGYLELKRELAQHPGFLDLRQMCSCKAHQGNRWLPKTEFSGGDVYCKWCRAEMTHQRYVASSQQPGAPSKRKYQSRTQARPRTYNRRTSSMAG